MQNNAETGVWETREHSKGGTGRRVQARRNRTTSYQPIENYGIIGNMRTVALVGDPEAPAPLANFAANSCPIDRGRLPSGTRENCRGFRFGER
jgi:hypothetical protein